MCPLIQRVTFAPEGVVCGAPVERSERLLDDRVENAKAAAGWDWRPAACPLVKRAVRARRARRAEGHA